MLRLELFFKIFFMNKIEKFEELICWQESRKMVKDIVELY